MKKRLFLLLVSLFVIVVVTGQKGKHTFKFSEQDFLLDDESFQIISGELHPARIPVEYWEHRIKMAKAMGCNTISIYIFWNYHETEEGVFDFETGNKNISNFIELVKENDMWLIIRPGPYVCAEWDLGGLPPYLLRIPDIKLRSMDPRYMSAAERYIAKLSEVIKPHMISNGGPIIMLQIENEYGSFANDKNYLLRLRDVWKENGISLPTFTADGPSTSMLEAGTIPGSAVGLDSGSSQADFDLAAKINPGVPVFSSETYPGWLTHWGEEWARPDTADLLKEVRFLMDNKKSFNFYVIHGGTNFGYSAGANSGGKGYEPDITSYDYDAPVNERGEATPKYMAIRELIGSYLPKGKKLPNLPELPLAIEIPLIFPSRFTSVWDNLPEPVVSETPMPMEYYGQDYGFILYQTELAGIKSGKLVVSGIHDFATVFLNGAYIGKLDRREGINSIEIPETQAANPQLQIFVEAMGRINYGKNLGDRKGITDTVTLNGVNLMNWKVYNLPLDRKYIYNLRSTGKSGFKPGIFFKGNVSLAITGDTYLDLSGYSKGVVWVNGNNIGRYWDIGPQKKLFCPASFLRTGMNEVIIFDMLISEPKPLTGATSME